MSPGSDHYLVGSEEQKKQNKKTKGTLVFTLIVVIALDYQEVGKKTQNVNIPVYFRNIYVWHIFLVIRSFSSGFRNMLSISSAF